MSDFDYLTTLPGEDRERRWLQERLETLSVREGIVLSAAVLRTAPEDMAQAVNCLQSLDDYDVRLDAGSYAALGEAELHRKTTLPDSAMPFVDLAAMGRQYEIEHPGLFVGDCYVEYPEKNPQPAYQRGGPLPEDNGWSVRLKLSSATVPEGVWLCLPGQFNGDLDCTVDEVMTLRTLGTCGFDECALTEARCILPEIGDLLQEYDCAGDLIYDGIELGITLGQRGQGMPQFMERFAAAMELENCHSLRLAMDIANNLHCYDWVSSGQESDFAAQRLQKKNVSDDFIRSGFIDLKGYSEELLEQEGFQLASGEVGYIRRNSQEFKYLFSDPAPEQSGMSMQ